MIVIVLGYFMPYDLKRKSTSIARLNVTKNVVRENNVTLKRPNSKTFLDNDFKICETISMNIRQGRFLYSFLRIITLWRLKFPLKENITSTVIKGHIRALLCLKSTFLKYVFV